MCSVVDRTFIRSKNLLIFLTKHSVSFRLESFSSEIAFATELLKTYNDNANNNMYMYITTMLNPIFLGSLSKWLPWQCTSDYACTVQLYCAYVHVHVHSTGIHYYYV